MAPIAGWYDDPRDASRLRYWDGDAWTEQISAKPPAAAAPQWTYPGAPPTQQHSWQYGGPSAQQLPQTERHVRGNGPTTPDGVPMTTWVKRFAARLLDLVFVFVGGLPFLVYFIVRSFQAISDQLNNGTGSTLMPDNDVIRWEIALFAMFIVLQAVYEVFCLSRWGATPGKRIMDISVRSYARGGPLTSLVIARRVGFMYGLWALNLVPGLSLPAFLLLLVNMLWPVWDKRRQALSDKVAGTVVVDGPQQPVAGSAGQ